jgi:hypothetical protein
LRTRNENRRNGSFSITPRIGNDHSLGSDFYAYNIPMTINGIEFDDPRVIPISKRDMREYKEGVRTTVKEMWVCGYVREKSSVCMYRYCITMTNRGVCTFDGKQIKNESEKKLIAELFETTKPEK